MTKHALITQEFDLSREALFDFFGDHDKFGSALPVPVKRIVDSTGENPNGEGSIRKVGVGPVGIEETIVTWEAPNRIQYIISKGGWPIKNYLATIDFFEVESNRCRIDYRIEFDFPLPFVGSALVKGMEKTFSELLSKLAKSPDKISQPA